MTVNVAMTASGLSDARAIAVQRGHPEAVPFAQVVEVALAVRSVFDKAGVPSFCRTSGKRGLHVYVPMGRRYEHGTVKMLGELVCRLVEQRLPDLTSREPGAPTGGKAGSTWTTPATPADSRWCAILRAAPPGRDGVGAAEVVRGRQAAGPVEVHNQDDAQAVGEGGRLVGRRSGAGH